MNGSSHVASFVGASFMLSFWGLLMKRLSVEISDEVHYKLRQLFPLYGELSEHIRDVLDDMLSEEYIKDEIRETAKMEEQR